MLQLACSGTPWWWSCMFGNIRDDMDNIWAIRLAVISFCFALTSAQGDDTKALWSVFWLVLLSIIIFSRGFRVAGEDQQLQPKQTVYVFQRKSRAMLQCFWSGLFVLSSGGVSFHFWKFDLILQYFSYSQVSFILQHFPWDETCQKCPGNFFTLHKFRLRCSITCCCISHDVQLLLLGLWAGPWQTPEFDKKAAAASP